MKTQNECAPSEDLDHPSCLISLRCALSRLIRTDFLHVDSEVSRARIQRGGGGERGGRGLDLP